MGMKNFDAGARDSAAAGTAMVTLYVDAFMAANQVMLRYARLMTAFVLQAYPLPAGAARTVGPAAERSRDASGAATQPDLAPESPAPASLPPVATAPHKAAQKKPLHQKKAAAPSVNHRSGVAKRRVQAAR